MTTHPVYQYLIFNVKLVYACFQPVRETDVSLSEDIAGDVTMLREALAGGFRWIRTEGERAIFEREVTVISMEARTYAKDKAASAHA